MHRTHTSTTRFSRSSKSARAVMLIALTGLIGTLYGCDGGDGGPVAQLSAVESSNVPGRIGLDGRYSFANGNRKLVSYTYTVKNQDTGETVYGPITIRKGMSRGPLKVYPYANNAATNGVKDVSGFYEATLTVKDDAGQTDTVKADFPLHASVAYALDACDATCSKASNGSDRVVCTLPSSCNAVLIGQNTISPAARLNPAINAKTTLWLQAIGARGGDGTDAVFGGDSGAGGNGGFAQTITNSIDLAENWGQGYIYYYLGQAGSHDDSGGSGGASTIVTGLPQSGALQHNEIILIAGGGGGGGEGSAFYSGSDRGGGGGKGGFAYSTQVGKSATAKGSDAFYDGLPSLDGSWFTNTNGLGGGGTNCSAGIACGGDGYHSGFQGFGGVSGGSGSEGSKSWTNGSLDLANAGKGAEGGDPATCGGGGGGGGYGGGGSGTVYGTLSSGGDDYRCYGGGGGGSYAAASTTTDADAPTSHAGGTGNGEVLMIFNPNPS